MKLNKMLALALSLSAGMALGAAPRAGTAITNQASVDFQVTDPTAADPIISSSSSNVVTTTVAAVPSFTITPNTGDTALTKNNVPANTAASFNYTVTNTGNTPLVVNLASANTANAQPIDGSVTLSTNTVTLQPGATAQVTHYIVHLSLLF